MLTPSQRRLLEPMRRGEPVPINTLVSILYDGNWTGGPNDPAGTIRTQIHYLRARLAPHRIAILTIPYQGYMVDPDHLERLTDLLMAFRAVEMAKARGAAFAAVTS